MSNNSFLSLPDNTNTELGRLKNISSGIDLPPEYREIYNAEIFVDYIDSVAFAQLNTDATQPANNKLVLDNAEAIARYNETAEDTVSAGNSNFGAFTGNNIADESNLDTNTSDTNKNKDKPPRHNPLHDFAPYNYITTLTAMSKEAFNSGGLTGEEIVIAKSGGKNVNGQDAGIKDYFINNLVVRNTLSQTLQGRSATIYQVLFDVYEPYGTTFIDDLIKAAKKLGYKNHLKAVYNLKVEFKGYADEGPKEGQPVDEIPFTTRIIPLHINQVDMNIDAGGTQYTVQCTPATNLGLTDLHGKTKETITVTGSTVGEVIKSFFKTWSATLKTLQSQGKAKILDEYTLDIEQSTEILNSKLGYGEFSNVQGSIQVSNLQGFPSLKPEVNAKASARQFSVPAGTKVQTLIEAVVKDSEFLRKQFDDSMNPNGTYIRTLRTYTQLEIGSYDNQTGRPQYKFKYILREQKISSSYFIKQSTDLVTNVNPVRTYNYIYTGKNQDVLDFQLTYNLGYYYPISYSTPSGKTPSTDGGKATYQQEESNQDFTNGAEKGAISVSSEPINEQDNGFLPGQYAKNDQALTLIEQIIEDPAADLIAVDMEVLGDPGFMEQKSVTNRSMKGTFVEESPGIDSSGAVSTDEYECYVQVNFKVPTDLNDETGLFDKINSNDTAFFRGIYKVYACEHRFDQGIYTTLLSMVRMRYQNQDDKLNSPEQINNQSATSSNNEGATQTNGQSFPNYNPPGYGSSYEPSLQVDGKSSSDNVSIGFAPEGFSDDFMPNLPIPKIDMTFSETKLREQQDLINEIRRHDYDKNTRLRGGI